MPDAFLPLFQPKGPNGGEASKFLSRLFGIFSERIVAIWAADPRAPFENLGRPTLRDGPEGKPATLDFTLRERATGAVFVAEMKCEIEYQGFRYYLLTRPDQLQHHKKPGFDLFLRSALSSASLRVELAGRPIRPDGAILIWGAVSPEGRAATIAAFGFREVLSVADLCADLADWANPDYAALLTERRDWCDRLFTGLMSLPRPASAEGVPRS